MKNIQKIIAIFSIALSIVFMFTLPFGSAKEQKENEKSFTLPKNMMSIAKHNTFPNIAEDDEKIEPSELTKQLLEQSSIEIENPALIKLLNETTIKPSMIGFGYRGMIYLGRWPLHYESEDISINWDYQLINENDVNNMLGDDVVKMQYIQKDEKEVSGALTKKIESPTTVKKMMLRKSMEQTKLPLSFSTIVGSNTKLAQYYNVPPKNNGQLQAYVPAVNEKGKVTYGEVYIELKGRKKSIVIKNITTQGIGAWIPIQDHISLLFQLE